MVPPTPKDETWAWPCEYRYGLVSVQKIASNAAWSRWGFSVFRWMVGAHLPMMHIMMHLFIAIAAALPSRCPMLDLLVAIMRGSDLRILIWTFLTAPTSMGSPSDVPVPWHSQTVDSGGVIRASRTAPQMHFSCAGPFGADRLALRPSWPIWLPRK